MEEPAEEDGGEDGGDEGGEGCCPAIFPHQKIQEGAHEEGGAEEEDGFGAEGLGGVILLMAEGLEIEPGESDDKEWSEGGEFAGEGVIKAV